MDSLYLYTGLALIIIGAILFFLAIYMIDKHEKKLMENERLYKSFMREKQNEKRNVEKSFKTVATIINKRFDK
jgi:sortase (surface protein transpeptidase)|tara:strand:+ start:469 stop:687 length:219 start_codon:yes stop_codon:yes gene_type:complete